MNDLKVYIHLTLPQRLREVLDYQPVIRLASVGTSGGKISTQTDRQDRTTLRDPEINFNGNEPQHTS